MGPRGHSSLLRGPDKFGSSGLAVVTLDYTHSGTSIAVNAALTSVPVSDLSYSSGQGEFTLGACNFISVVSARFIGENLGHRLEIEVQDPSDGTIEFETALVGAQGTAAAYGADVQMQFWIMIARR
jgi:hypothetical protein